MPQAVERLLALYASEKNPGEEAGAFFGRVDLARVKGILADLETGAVSADDFVDLGDSTAFKVEAMAGECSA